MSSVLSLTNKIIHEISKMSWIALPMFWIHIQNEETPRLITSPWRTSYWVSQIVENKLKSDLSRILQPLTQHVEVNPLKVTFGPPSGTMVLKITMQCEKQSDYQNCEKKIQQYIDSNNIQLITSAKSKDGKSLMLHGIYKKPAADNQDNQSSFKIKLLEESKDEQENESHVQELNFRTISSVAEKYNDKLFKTKQEYGSALWNYKSALAFGAMGSAAIGYVFGKKIMGAGDQANGTFTTAERGIEWGKVFMMLGVAGIIKTKSIFFTKATTESFESTLSHVEEDLLDA